MKLRVARHTSNLQPLIDFYTGILGLQVIGGFKDHDNYDGVFLGGKNVAWHLEFTVSDDAPDHHADADDLLVVYPTIDEFELLKERINNKNIKITEPKNPYWKENGICIVDPDGFGIVIAKPGD